MFERSFRRRASPTDHRQRLRRHRDDRPGGRGDESRDLHRKDHAARGNGADVSAWEAHRHPSKEQGGPWTKANPVYAP